MKKNLFLFFLFSILTTCTKYKNCPRYFELPIQVSPIKSEYKIGDTLLFESKFHKDMIAYNSIEEEVCRTFDMEGIPWKPVTDVFRLDVDTTDWLSVFEPNFNFVENSKFNYYTSSCCDGATYLTGTYNFESDTFFLQYQIIPVDTGLFMHVFRTLQNDPTSNNHDYPGRCNGCNYELWFKMNNGIASENNIHLLQESPMKDGQLRRNIEDTLRYTRIAKFTFKVVE